MPTYDYACGSCGHAFEELQNMSDAPLVTCPKCNNDALKRQVAGGLGVIFRGGGFYVNDSRPKSSGQESA